MLGNGMRQLMISLFSMLLACYCYVHTRDFNQGGAFTTSVVQLVLSDFDYAPWNRRPGRHSMSFAVQFFLQDAQESGAVSGGLR